MGSVAQSLLKPKGLSKMFGLGELPKEYKPKVHGPYDPAIYYGPKDKAFGNVKISELPGWLGRRGMYSPVEWGEQCLVLTGDGILNICYLSTPERLDFSNSLLVQSYFSTLSTLRSSGAIEISSINGKASSNFVSIR